MSLYNIPNSLLYFSRYNWYLRSLNTKEAERRKVLADIRSGLISRDTIDEGWQDSLNNEIDELKKRLYDIEFTVKSMPETPELLPCKLFLRLHFIMGMTMTDTAETMNISLSTLRRIKDKAAMHFENFPPHKFEESI